MSEEPSEPKPLQDFPAQFQRKPALAAEAEAARA